MASQSTQYIICSPFCEKKKDEKKNETFTPARRTTKSHEDKLALIKQEISGIIFDMDETIIRSDHIWHKAFDLVFIKNGLTEELRNTITLDQSAFDGQPAPVIIAYLKEQFGITTNASTLLAQLRETMCTLFAEDHVPLVPGFKEFHEILREADIKTAIASNCGPFALQTIAERYEFDKIFNGHVYSAGRVCEKRKPEPDVFYYAADQINADRSDCVVFEDSLTGFTAAQKAGMRCIAIINEKNNSFFDQHTDGGISTYDHAIDALYQLAIEKLDAR